MEAKSLWRWGIVLHKEISFPEKYKMGNFRFDYARTKLKTLISIFQKCVLMNYVYYSSEPIKLRKLEHTQQSILIRMTILLRKSTILLTISYAVGMQSRYSNANRYKAWIRYWLTSDPIRAWYCQCKTGGRTVGCYAHIANVVWYLCNARHTDLT